MTSGPAAIATRHPAGVQVLAAREHRVVRLALLPVPEERAVLERPSHNPSSSPPYK